MYLILLLQNVESHANRGKRQQEKGRKEGGGGAAKFFLHVKSENFLHVNNICNFIY